MKPTMRFVSLARVLLLAAALLPGCGYVRELNLPLITPKGKKLDAGAVKTAAYPDSLPIAQPMEIEVIRVGGAIELDNRSGRSFKDAELWLNHQYGALLADVPVGRTAPINLESFINGYGEKYPVGKFLEPDRDRAVVMADLVIDGKVHKLIVRLADGWRRPAGT